MTVDDVPVAAGVVFWQRFRNPEVLVDVVEIPFIPEVSYHISPSQKLPLGVVL